ncbi:MAG: hypothetical protein SOR83_02070 [Butyricicoccus pullicaecorum]|nr:hypothetical protein [Butyricicoccus pullicaecorum]
MDQTFSKVCGVLRQSLKSPVATGEIPFLIPVKDRNQPKQTKRKDRPFGRSFQRLRILRDALFLFIFVDFREAKIKRGFRVLRDTAQGSALRTRKPFEKGLRESFISPAGGITP